MYVLIIYVLLGIASLYTILHEDKRNRKLEWILYGAVALFFGIRFSIGQDTGSYSWMYLSVAGTSSEPVGSHMLRNFGYTALNYLVKYTFGEFRYVVLLSNLIILGLCTWVVYKRSRNPLLSMMLFVGSGMLEVYFGSGLRQGIAMALYLFAFYAFLPRKKYLLFELFVLLAIGFHEISVVLIPIPLLILGVKKFKAHPYRITLITSVIAGGLMWFVNEYAEGFEYRITQYTGYEPAWTHMLAYFHRHNFSLAGIAMEIVFLAGIMLLYYFAEKKDWDNFRYFEIMTFVYSCVLYFLTSCYSIMSRASDLIQIIILVLLPALISELPDRMKKLLAFGAVFALNFVLLYTDLSVKCEQVSNNEVFRISMENYPYITVFDKAKIDTLYEK